MFIPLTVDPFMVYTADEPQIFKPVHPCKVESTTSTFKPVVSHTPLSLWAPLTFIQYENPLMELLFFRMTCESLIFQSDIPRQDWSYFTCVS